MYSEQIYILKAATILYKNIIKLACITIVVFVLKIVFFVLRAC